MSGRSQSTIGANDGMGRLLSSAAIPPQPLLARAGSALVLAPPVLLIAYWGGAAFALMVATAAAIVGWEWCRMTAPSVAPETRASLIGILVAAVGIVAFGLPGAALLLLGCAAAVLWRMRPADAWLASGVIYLGLPCVCLIWLRGDANFGRIWVFWLLAVVWSSDIGAYLTGSLIGGPRLAPRISPKKTWSGFAGGLMFASMAGMIAATVWGRANLSSVVLASVAIGFSAQAGDLFESWVKRRFGVKDSSALIPGHGGLLDRIDALMAASVVTALIAALSQGRMWTWP